MDERQKTAERLKSALQDLIGAIDMCMSMDPAKQAIGARFISEHTDFYWHSVVISKASDWTLVMDGHQ